MSIGPQALEELCLRRLECCITLSTVLPLLSLFQQELVLWQYDHFRCKCECFVSNNFEALCCTEGLEAVRRCLKEDKFTELAAARRQDKENLNRYRRKLRGSVVDRQIPCTASTSVKNSEMPGTTAGPRYPLAWLKAGMRWPDDVDSARREEHLTDADFIAAFGIDRPLFCKLPHWKQQILKKEASLF